MELRLHAQLAIKVLQVPALQLWYYCRGLDLVGSGRVVLPSAALRTFHKDRTTTWRWLNNSVLFRKYSFNRAAGTYTVYMRSLPKVCKALGVTALGGIGWTDTVTDLPAQAALLQAQHRQSQAAWLAERTKLPGMRVCKPELYFDYLGQPLSEISPGSRASRATGIRSYFQFAGRTIAMVSRRTAMYGASVKGIASSLGIAYATAVKLLKGTTRIQLAQTISWKYFFKARFEQSENLGVALESGFFTKQNTLPVKLLPYRYYPLFTTTNQRKLRQRVNAASK